MAKTTPSATKASAKRPTIKTTATKSKYSGKNDRFTSEQRRRINEYKESLKTIDVKSPSLKKLGTLTPSRRHLKPASTQIASDSMQGVPATTRAGKDPPVAPHTRSRLFSAASSNQRSRNLSACKSENKERRDPPNCIPVPKEPMKDPPTEDEAEVTENKSPKNVTTNITTSTDAETAAATFSEALYSQWNVLRRGLQALGLVRNDANTDVTGEVDDETFYDALEENSPIQRKYLVEDVSDEDEEICQIRRASLHSTPNRGDPWMHPVGSPLIEVSPRRFAKPDP